MIKAVIFDIGGVILNMEKLAFPVTDIFRPDDNESFWQDLNEKFSPLCRGEGTLPGFWESLARDYKKDIPKDILNKLWDVGFENNISLNDDVKKIIIALSKRYRLAIISNVIALHAEKLKNNKKFYDLMKYFEVITYSYEVRMSKDSKEIFEHTINLLKLDAKECFFTDDTKKFIDVARSIGINSSHFKTASQLKKDLKCLGVMV